MVLGGFRSFHVLVTTFQIVSFTVYQKKIPARVSDFFPTIDLVPTNLFLVLFFAETLVKPPSFFSFSSTVSSAILFMKTADHFRPVMLCSPLCKGYETSTEVKRFIQRRSKTGINKLQIDLSRLLKESKAST